MPVPCGNSSVGRARPCQGRGREFESRFPLQKKQTKPRTAGVLFFSECVGRAKKARTRTRHGRGASTKKPIGLVAEWSCSGLQSRVRRFDSDPGLQTSRMRLCLLPFAERANIRHATQAARGARMAKSVDARDLKSLGGNPIPVRFRVRAPYLTASYVRDTPIIGQTRVQCSCRAVRRAHSPSFAAYFWIPE